MADEKDGGAVVERDEVAAGVVAAPSSKSGLLLTIIICAVTIVVSAGVTFVVARMTAPSAPSGTDRGASSEGEKKSAHGGGEKAGHEGGEKAGVVSKLVAVKEVYVNIAETKGTRILKIVPNLVVSEDALAKEMMLAEALVRDRIGAAAAKMTLDDLDGVNGRENLKKEIMTLINLSMQNKMAGVVTDVYFSEYLIQ
ncbi:MAG: flagellar basal body-associated FliL family protein [bacterium]